MSLYNRASFCLVSLTAELTEHRQKLSEEYSQSAKLRIQLEEKASGNSDGSLFMMASLHSTPIRSDPS
jgi:hypothetical protein